ncbi:hypothetical protein PR001_g18482 [Phytophthora rubi]|uniref:DDE Tnp4 domain-containing protein n=1 Tax=Phytophthora rubi TaxID=129364 RepID=A0A6A3K7P9_9STRA|nr:hypothetical protein PR001_g18482 [Phytophthora rubi]
MSGRGEAGMEGVVDMMAQVQQPSNPDVQNACYNGWLHNVCATGALCFSVDGLIVWTKKHNCPGSWNDGDTSLAFRRILADPTLNPDPRYGIVGDSAFPCGKEMAGRVMPRSRRATWHA